MRGECDLLYFLPWLVERYQDEVTSEGQVIVTFRDLYSEYENWRATEAGMNAPDLSVRVLLKQFRRLMPTFDDHSFHKQSRSLRISPEFIQELKQVISMMG